MLYNRTYLDKFTTIVNGSRLNTGFNPVSELVYGRNNSRALIHFDHRKIQKMVEDKAFPDITKLKHRLKITNAGSIDFSELHKIYGSQIDGYEKKRATSFDLILFLIPEEWDNGKGFDYTKDTFSIDVYDKNTFDGDRYVSYDGATWYQPKNGYQWKKEPEFQKTVDNQLTFYIKSDKSVVDRNGDTVIFTYSCCHDGGFANKNLVFKSLSNSLDNPLTIHTPVFFSKSGQICDSEESIIKYAQYARVRVDFPRNKTGNDRKFAFRCEYEIDGVTYKSNPYFLAEKKIEETNTEFRSFECFIGSSQEEILNDDIIKGFCKFYGESDELEAYANTSFGDYLWFVIPSDLNVQEITSNGMPVSLYEYVQQISTDFGDFKCYRSQRRLDTAYWPILLNTDAYREIKGSEEYNSSDITSDGIYTTKSLESELNLFENGKESIVIGKQHFDIGCENIDIDITNVFNKFITGELKNYGIGIAYAPTFEYMETNTENYVGLITNRTNSFFEPYVESIYEDSIKDDRQNFVLGRVNRLYLYANIGGDLVNLDRLPTCSVNGTEYEVRQAGTGIYYIEISLPQNAFNAPTMLYDVWDGIMYNGEALSPVEMEFTTKPSSMFFQLGYNMPEKGAFTPTVYGINDSEHIKRGDIRKLCFLFKKDYARNTGVVVDDVEARLYIMDGTAQVTVIPYIKANRAFTDTYIMIDTGMLIPNTYYLDVRVKYGMEMIEHHDVLHFSIVNEENNRFA